jgi:hypothetical protein
MQFLTEATNNLQQETGFDHKQQFEVGISCLPFPTITALPGNQPRAGETREGGALMQSAVK